MVRHLTVTLDKDYREDDAQEIVRAIMQMRHVVSVTPRIVDGQGMLAGITARNDLRDTVTKFITDLWKVK